MNYILNNITKIIITLYPISEEKAIVIAESSTYLYDEATGIGFVGINLSPLGMDDFFIIILSDS